MYASMSFGTGIALFFLGLFLLRSGLEHLASPAMQRSLHGLTASRFKAFLTGLFVTGLLQSSSVVTVLVVTLTHAGTLTLQKAIPLVLGSNAGTAVTLELLTIPLNKITPWLLVAGLMLLILPSAKGRSVGISCIGFSILFTGMVWMTQGLTPLVAQPFWEMLWREISHPAIALGMGLFITAILQSSTVAIAIFMGWAAISEPSAGAMVGYILGSNIGTCITALLASFCTNTAGQQVAAFHLLFNLFGALLVFPLIPWITPLLAGIELEPAAKIAHLQLLYNILGGLVALPWCNAMAWVIVRLYGQRSK